MKMKIVFGMLIAITLSSCSTLLTDKNEPLYVNSNVQGAEVLINNQMMGVTPLQTTVRRRSKIEVMVRKEGYVTRTSFVDTKIDPMFWLNLFTYTAGSTTDFLNDTMHKLDSNSIYIELTPSTPQERPSKRKRKARSEEFLR